MKFVPCFWVFSSGVCVGKGGSAPLVANRKACCGSRESFIIVNADDGSLIADRDVANTWEESHVFCLQG